MQARSSIHLLPQKAIFSETFQDLASVMKNGWILSGTGVSIKNGTCYINGSGNNIYNKYIGNARSTNVAFKGKYVPTIRLIFTLLNSGSSIFSLQDPFANTNAGYGAELDVGNNSVINAAYFAQFYTALYVNGVQVNTTTYKFYSNILYDFVFQGTTNYIPKNVTLGYRNSGITNNNISVNLFECYNYLLSAGEVADLYQQTLYNDPTK